MLGQTLSALFNPVAQWAVNELPKIVYDEFPKALLLTVIGSAFTIAVSKYYASQQTRRDRRAMNDQKFNTDHVAVISLTQYKADDSYPGMFEQDITTLDGAMSLKTIFRNSYKEIMPLIEKAAKLSVETGNPNLIQLLPEVIRAAGQEKDLPGIMKTLEDDWKNAFSPFWNGEQDITRYFNFVKNPEFLDQDGQVTIYPILTLSQEGAERYRVLMLPRSQLQCSAYPEQKNLCYETHDGYELDDTVHEGASRLSTLKGIAAHMDEATEKLLYVRVRGDYRPKEQENLISQDGSEYDEPVIIPFPRLASSYSDGPHIAA